jgi:hypothetical protein
LELVGYAGLLDRWGYLYFAAANELTYAETALEQYRSLTGGRTAGHGTSILDPSSSHAELVAQKCDSVLGLIEGSRDELVPIPFHLEMLRTKIRESRKPHQLELYTNDILDDVRKILNDLRLHLSIHNFYYVQLALAKFYGKPLLFGEAVAKKFPKAARDIERAGNCLALGEATACVLHLSRAMEIATRRLAGKLNVALDAKDSWGMVSER